MIKIYAPASIGNIIVGFDTLGVAIKPINKNIIFGDQITVKSSKKFHINNTGKFTKKIPKNKKKNIIYLCWKAYCKKIKKNIPLNFKLEKNIPISSGLGSSASCIVATLVAINKHCNNLLNNNKILRLMGKIEKKISGNIHFDNVAPSFLGGMQIILNTKNIISQKLPNFKNWLWIIAYPGLKISTNYARNILPKQYSKKDCILNARYLAGFIHSIHTNQPIIAKKMMKDIIAEKYRSPLLPFFKKIKKKSKKIGAISFGISGSGPTLFATSNNINTAKKLLEYFKKNYIFNKHGFVYICKTDNIGARII